MAALLLSPIRAVLPEIRQSTAFYVLCTEQPLPPLPDRNCLCLSFADTENERHPNVFRREQAVQLRQFFDALPEDADLFVCCDSGQSRSAAIKAALLRYQGKDDRGIWDDPNYHPNACVYVDHYVYFTDKPMLQKLWVDWTCAPYGFCKLILWAPELVRQFGGSFETTLHRFYLDRELYERKRNLGNRF